MGVIARQDGSYALYHYDPSIAAATVFVLLFLATTGFHCWQAIRLRCGIATPLVVGGLMEVIGFIGRIMSGRESPNWTLGPYIIQAILLLVAPALFAATIYMAFGRLVTGAGAQSYTLIRHKWITKIFVAGDVLSFFLQAGGGGYQSSGTQSALEMGSHIIVVGLFVQLAFFGFFMVIALCFHRRLVLVPTIQSHGSFPWKKYMWTLYGASTLIMVRSVFRVVEYLQGSDGALLHHEAYLYTLDALLMFAVMILFNVIHPSGVIGGIKGNARDTIDVHLERFYGRV